jgi:hypothetical protein
MVEGLYGVAFSASNNRFGGGVLVIRDGKAFGGDAQYYYTGTVERSGEQLKFDIRVRHFHGQAISVFGDSLLDCTVKGTGKVSQDGASFEGQGEMVGKADVELTVAAKRLETLS